MIPAVTIKHLKGVKIPFRSDGMECDPDLLSLLCADVPFAVEVIKVVVWKHGRME